MPFSLLSLANEVNSRMLNAFVSENDLEERRKKRQEEWEKVRKPEDPVGKYIL